MEINAILAGICAFSVVLNIGLLIVIMLTLRACQKMYTEYFKDRSITARSK
jgi:hypothetical protein